jgi:hypothetical protein
MRDCVFAGIIKNGINTITKNELYLNLKQLSYGQFTCSTKKKKLPVDMGSDYCFNNRCGRLLLYELLQKRNKTSFR